MLMANRVWQTLRTIVCGNPATIGGDDPDAPKMKAIIGAYVDNPNLVVGDLVLGTAEFFWEILAEDGSIDEGIHPVTFAAMWQRRDIAKNYSLKCSNTGAGTTCFGVALISNDEATLYATEQLETPITVTAEGQEFDIPRMRFSFPRDVAR